MRVLTAFLGLVVAALVGLYGAFLVLYQGEQGSEGDTYLDFGGRKVDADYVGIPLVVLALFVAALSLRALRNTRVR